MISPVKPTWQRPHPFNLHQPAMPHLRPTSSISLPLASLLLSLALSVAGCSPKTDTAAETPAETATVAPATATPQAEPASTTAQASASAASSPEATAAAVTLVKGIYTWGPEVETFSPCNTNKTYWLEGSDAMLAPLQEMALKKADAGNEAYQPIYGWFCSRLRRLNAVAPSRSFQQQSASYLQAAGLSLLSMWQGRG